VKFLVVNTDYPAFLRSLYNDNPGLDSMSFADQERARVDSLFGVADFYSRNLRKLGHETFDVWANNEPMQRAWAHENDYPVPSGRIRVRFGGRKGVPWPSLSRHRRWFYGTLAAQIERYRPDVLLNQDVVAIEPDFLGGVKAHVGLLVGQHAATPLPDVDYSCYDLLISSFLPMVEDLRARGYPAELHRLGFESDLVEEIPAGDRDLDVSFVGSFESVHSSRLSFLEMLCEQVPNISVFAPSVERVPESSLVRRAYVGEAWGHDMYRVLGRSKVTINHLGDVAPYSNNLRIYEATGMGALLLTQRTKNLAELFSVGEELAEYTSAQHCAQLISHYLDNSEEREGMADAGQDRTLSDHTWLGRMRELIEIVESYS
jgi:hypothetical protein